MTVYAAWVGAEVPADLRGPWVDLHVAAPGLVLIDSVETLSRVYHELKWSLPPETGLLVTAVAGLPKLSRVNPGTLSWLRHRVDRNHY